MNDMNDMNEKERKGAHNKSETLYYGYYNNIPLTSIEYSRLKEKFPRCLDKVIERASENIYAISPEGEGIDSIDFYNLIYSDCQKANAGGRHDYN